MASSVMFSTFTHFCSRPAERSVYIGSMRELLPSTAVILPLFIVETVTIDSSFFHFSANSGLSKFDDILFCHIVSDVLL